MFDALRGRKFSTKCKSLIKLTKVRMESIKKKRNSVQKYLRNDIADLIKSGLDINAYGRAEGLLVELNMTSCYEMIEQFYAAASTQLPVMDKQKECPEECREAVSSLMYAAARFADLPELRDLRNMFTHRYGSSMDAFVNKEFVEKLKANPPTKDMKLKLLQDIAHNSSIEWNSKGLEQKLYVPPPEPDHPATVPDDKYDDGYRMQNRKEDVVTKRSNSQGVTDKAARRDTYAASNQDVDDLPFHPRKVAEEQKKPDDEVKNRSHDEEQQKSSGVPFYSKFMPPPPYVRSKPNPTAAYSDSSDEMASNKENVIDKMPIGSASEQDQKPKPKSVRRRNLKLPPGREKLGGDAKTGLKVLCRNNDEDQNDDEEKLMDEILVHYSKKDSPYNSSSSSSLGQNGGINFHSRAKSFSPPLLAERKVAPQRASSFEPEMIKGHVHPKLPDYDDLAARIAALSSR